MLGFAQLYFDLIKSLETNEGIFDFQASKKLDEKSKSDVLELLGELEGELEAKDIAIATLKVRIIQI